MMGIQQHSTGSAQPLQLDFAALPRPALEALTEALIGHLDALDGDPDLEPNGDELDGSLGEDDFCLHRVSAKRAGPGCPVSDPDCAVDDKECDEDFDLEQNEPNIPYFGIDQTANAKGYFLVRSLTRSSRRAA